MIRSTLLAALIAPALLAASPASAETRIEARMPVIAASVTKQGLTLRLPDGVMGRTKPTMTRTLAVEAFDSNGASLGRSAARVGKRLTYARLPLTPAMASAARLVVSAE